MAKQLGTGRVASSKKKAAVKKKTARKKIAKKKGVKLDDVNDVSIVESEETSSVADSKQLTETEAKVVVSDTQPFVVDNITVRFPSTVGIDDIAVLKTVLDEQVSGCAVIINTESVGVIDAAIAQLLLAFCIEAEANGVFMDWESPSAAFLDALQLLGLSGKQGLPEAA